MLRTLQFCLEFKYKCQRNNNRVNIYLKNIIYLENLNTYTYIYT